MVRRSRNLLLDEKLINENQNSMGYIKFLGYYSRVVE